MSEVDRSPRVPRIGVMELRRNITSVLGDVSQGASLQITSRTAALREGSGRHQRPHLVTNDDERLGRVAASLVADRLNVVLVSSVALC